MYRCLLLLLLVGLTSISRASLMTLIEGSVSGVSENGRMLTSDPLVLFDFTSPDVTEEDLAGWVESSDTVREPGMSKAAIVLQKSQLFQRAVMFALLNPQPNGAGFAGVRANISGLDQFREREGFLMQVRCQGQLAHWKIVLRNKEDLLGSVSLVTYERMFNLDPSSTEVQQISAPFAEFKAYYRGKPVENAPPLDLEKVGSFGLQAYGGVYEAEKQSGVGSLELDWVKIF